MMPGHLLLQASLMTKAKPQRRLGKESAENRLALIDATERLLQKEGYSAVTARNVAKEAGLKMPLVYYYFETMDELILEVVRKSSAKRLKLFIQALNAKDPLKALWEMHRDHTGGISTTELLALANHREAIRSEAVAAARHFRTLQIEAVEQHLKNRGVDTNIYPAAGIVTIITALTRAKAQDEALGVDEGYPEALQMVEAALAGLPPQ
ncbi:TetR/AcrR family transcriptional regulator [Pseudomaricurvus sp. HS19]|uniref:TetR/AcrR family transcriptional regulator n=1 Tax=Pseudomaricurvus sp. HS19 TaxID=2692626 RepID=UPI00136EF579|nr:TetR/AcrR family transcriptional regulator [Pseudomaricurvus sp. HS19]MYM61920.1 TetR family transcriptional regulator [Pseudomaricurvus sp. HS19]